MAVPVRITEGNYASLQHEADKEHRSIIQQLNWILEERYDRVSITGTPAKTTPPVKNIKPAHVASGLIKCAICGKYSCEC